VDWDEDDGEKPKGNGMDKLLKSAVATVGGSRGMTNLLRQILETGRAVVLVDGWNELGSQQQHLATTWLADLVNSLPGNTWVVNVGMRNYAPLTEAGFIPLSLAPWDARRVQEFAERWAEAWTTPDESPSISPHDLAIELRRAARAGASSLELALRAFVTLSDGQSPDGSAALFNRTLDLLLWQEQEQEEKPWLSAACRSALGQVALDLQQGERTMASREEVETAIEAALPPAEERSSRATARALRALTGERGLLRPTGSTSYTFTHPVWQAYLAARRLAAVDPSNLVEHLENPRWSDVLRFYAEIGDMGPLVAAWLRTPDDMFYMRLCTLSSWIRAAPEGSAWRDGAMALLARTFLQATPFARTRRTLAKSLAATGVPGVAHLFKQALQHPDAEFRAAAVLGLADVAGEADLSAFEPPLNDDDPTVRETAVRALASLGFDVAKQRLERVLQEEDDALRPVVAEVLAKHSEERVDILREMAQSEDVVTRRAAVSGLAKAGAHELLEEMMQEDEQWIVRTAASAALEEMQRREEPSGVEPTPEVEHLPWLNSWAAAQGEGVGLGEAAQQMLRRALQEGDDPVRLVAAQMLAQIGRSDDVELLRTMLADPNPAVADAALEALAEIGRRYDLRIEQQGR
jgi:HEAT repeat protein